MSQADQASRTAYLCTCDRLLWRLDRPRRELHEIIGGTEALLVQVPRRDVEHLLCWFNAIEAEDEDAMGVRAAIEDRIEALIACLDAIDADSDLEEDDPDDDDLREPGDMAA